MFIKISQSLSQFDIESIESIIKIKIPNELVTHYLKFNGGVPEDTYFYVEKDQGFVEVSFFLPIKYRSEKLGNMVMEESYVNLVKKNIILSKFLPFAVDWGGNYFCIDLENEDVVLILTDIGVYSQKSVKFLINGFNNFIENLEEEQEDEDEEED